MKKIKSWLNLNDVMPKNRILLLSTVHPINDPRIVGKIKNSLEKHFSVFCILPNKQYRRVFWRILLLQPAVLLKFLTIRPQIVHIFAPELLPLAFIFRWFGARIVYEVQENLYKKFPTKKYNKGWLFERLFSYFDQKARKSFYLIFTEDAYLNEYQNLANHYAIVHNFAKKEWLNLPQPTFESTDFLYAGVISNERAFDTMVAAIAILKKQYPTVKLHLFGRININLYDIFGYEDVKDNLIFYGYTNQQKIFETAQKTMAGIALLKPVGDYPDSYPSKIFDYMALGLPVITSDFELYTQLVEINECGFCISPNDAEMLAQKMNQLIENRKEAKKIGQNGRAAINKTYNWENEVANLIRLYERIL